MSIEIESVNKLYTCGQHVTAIMCGRIREKQWASYRPDDKKTQKNLTVFMETLSLSP